MLWPSFEARVRGRKRGFFAKGTEGSNPSPSSRESANPRSRSVVALSPKWHLHRLHTPLIVEGSIRTEPAFASPAPMRGARRAAADNRSPHENPSGVAEKLSFAASSYTAHLRRMSLSTNPAQAL